MIKGNENAMNKALLGLILHSLQKPEFQGDDIEPKNAQSNKKTVEKANELITDPL